uniref:FH2 domain-containing protein n=1 Tax=Ditylum brightwellii TaxID=49249 RepID=A0A7S4VZR6_9STRA
MDPAILDRNPDEPLEEEKKECRPALKDDPEYAKYFKMLKMKMPLGAVKQAMVRDGKDPAILDMDPDKPLKQKNESLGKQKEKTKAPKVVRKKLFWNAIDQSKLRRDSLWAQAQSEPLLLEGLDYDADEFANLFTSTVKGKGKVKIEKSNDTSSCQKVTKPKQPKVQLIDDRRNMNGSILLAKFKNKDFNGLAENVDHLDCMDMGETELCALRQLLPTKDESLALQSYLPAPGAPTDAMESAISKLGNCEKYMVAMLNVANVSRKFDCLLYRAQFDGRVEELTKEINSLQVACSSVRECDKLQRLLVYALRLGNQLNTGDSGNTAAAITLDSLLKLHEAKAFDKKTSVLHYLISIVKKNDIDVLSLAEELKPLQGAERIVGESLVKTRKELVDGLGLVKSMAKEESTRCSKEEENKVTSRQAPECSIDSSSSGGESDQISLPKEDDYLQTTNIGKFAIEADSTLNCVSLMLDNANDTFSDLLNYFGEDEDMPTNVFFTTLNRFLSMFECAREDVDRKDRAKLRQEKMAEKRKPLSK